MIPPAQKVLDFERRTGNGAWGRQNGNSRAHEGGGIHGKETG